MYATRKVSVPLLGDCFLCIITYFLRIIPCSDPDWDRIATEQTDIYLFFFLPTFNLKVLLLEVFHQLKNMNHFS